MTIDLFGNQWRTKNRLTSNTKQKQKNKMNKNKI